MLSFLSRDVLDEIWDLIESVSEGVPTYFGSLWYDRETILGKGRVIIHFL